MVNQDIQTFQKEFSQYLKATVMLPDVISHDYELVSCLKESGSRATYLICSTINQERFVLKCGDQTAFRDLQTEYQLLSSLSHPGLPRAISFFQQDGFYYLIREYSDGATLAEYVEEAGPFSEEAAIRAALSLCDMLEYLHKQNPPVIHRDIKPQNIVLTRQGAFQLIDFGTARRYQKDEKKDTAYLGTEATAAPEQFGYQQTDTRSDLYSTGVLLIFLCTGSYDLGACASIQNRQLKRCIEICTQFDPIRRYKSVRQLRADLSRAAKPVNRSMSFFLRGALLGLIVGAGLSFLLLPRISAPVSTLAAVATETSSAAEQAVTFTSPEIEQAVRKQLGYPDGTDLYPSDLNRITKLFITGTSAEDEWAAMVTQSIYTPNVPRGNISSLADIPKFPNLTELAVCNQQISDLSPLEGLPLTRLSLDNNQIIDLTPLSTLPYLSELYIGDNPVTRVDALKSCAALRKVDLGGTNVTDISPLSDDISQLLLNGTPIVEYSHLLDMKTLERLFVTDLSANNLAVVSQLTGLTELELHNNLLSLAPLLPLEKLERLTITHTQLQSIEGIETLHNLSYLCLEGVPGLDLSPLVKLNGLITLDISAQSVSDYSAVFRIPTLQTLCCTAAQKAEIDALGDSHSFEFLIIGS